MDLKDYLHLYLGCEIIHPDGSTAQLIGIIEQQAHFVHESNQYGFCSIDSQIFGKLLLRPLSDMTEDEAKKVAALAFDTDRNNYPLTDYRVRKPEQGTAIIVNIDNDWFYDMIRIGIETGNVYNDRKRIYNQSDIFKFLLSKHFDLFDLIAAGLAIDKTKI